MRGDSAEDALTVVVIGLNAAATLDRCLASIRRAASELGAAPRTLYVDGGSRDGSVEIARRAGTEVIQLAADRPTAAKGRNAGWRAAATPLVHFVDSDTVLDPAWLARATREIRADARIACLFGQLREANPTGSFYNEVCGHDWYVPPGDWRMCGGNALFRLEALRDVDGLDENLAAGEEADLCRRLRQRGWRIVCVDAPMALHDLGMAGFGAYWRRAVRSGYAYADVGLRYAGTRDRMWLRELVRNVAGPPAAVLVAAAVGLTLGPAGLAFLAAAVGSRLAWKVHTLRPRIPSSGERARYVVHLAFVRLPLFVGTMKYLVARRRGG